MIRKIDCGLSIASMILLIAGCGTTPPQRSSTPAPQKPAVIAAPSPLPPATSPKSAGGGYYKDDGPGANPPPNLDAIPDAQPKAEPLHRFANNPYTVFGEVYIPEVAPKSQSQRGVASWYGKKFHGLKTASGEIYDMYGMTAAHPTLPIPSYVRVTNVKNGKSVVVRVNDRGPFVKGRIIDLSYAAAHKLGYIGSGHTQVEVSNVDPADPFSNQALTKVAEITNLRDDMLVRMVYLQLGAFSAQQNAGNFLAQMKQELGYLSETLHIYTQEGLHRVRLGPYSDEAEAADVATKLKNKLAVAPVLVIQ